MKSGQLVDTDVQETLGREVTVRVESSGKPVIRL